MLSIKDLSRTEKRLLLLLLLNSLFLSVLLLPSAAGRSIALALALLTSALGMGLLFAGTRHSSAVPLQTTRRQLRAAALGNLLPGVVDSIDSTLAAVDASLTGTGDLQAVSAELKKSRHLTAELSNLKEPAPGEPVEISRTVMAIAAAIEPKLNAAGIDIRPHLTIGLPKIETPAVELQLLTLELITCSTSAMKPGDTIHVRCSAKDNGSLLSFEGAALPPSCTGDAATITGIPLCRSIAEESGGSLRVDDSREQRTTVHVWFPGIPRKENT